MNAEIITIGDEILIGQIVDTNSAYIAQELNKIGVSVYQITSVQDDKSHILKALNEAEVNADIVIVTGGLGPTKDDITKETLCDYFGDSLVMNQEVLKNIELLFSKLSGAPPLSELNRRQALVPSRCKVLMNVYGTAPGMWIEKNEKTFISLPGVPFEMKSLIQTYVLPDLQAKYNCPYILHRTILTAGMGESALAQKIEAWEDSLPSFIKLAYLPNFGKVRLRLTAKGMDKELIEQSVAEKFTILYELIGNIIYGEETEAIEETIGNLLLERGQTMATAESCTGGKIASNITSYSGASAYFKGSAVTYATQSKIDVLGVSSEVINEFSVVSSEVAQAMALGVKRLFNVDYGVATTGNAGPLKGDSDAEVGTVYIAIAGPNGITSEELHLGNHREKVINRAVNKAMELLQKEILKN